MSQIQDLVKQESTQRGVNINFNTIFPLTKPHQFSLYLKKAGLARRNIVLKFISLSLGRALERIFSLRAKLEILAG